MNCPICCETYTKCIRKPITCNYCNYVSCLNCIKIYLLDSVHTPHCMNCRHEWSHTFLIHHFHHFMKTEYREKREMILFEKQKALIPSLLPIAERKKKMETYMFYISRTQKELYSLYETTTITEDWRKEKRELKKTIRSLLNDYRYLLREDIHVERNHFIMKCTIEDCRGFLSSRYKCGLCSSQICSDCYLIKNTDHTCNPDTIATITELKKNTKSCPTCYIPIYKTEGCDQMWCIQCHTAFSWKTGNIEKGIIHNPHYFDYIKDKGIIPRNPLDVQCGGLPDYHQVYNYIIDQSFTYDEIIYLRKKYEKISHIREFMLPNELPFPNQQITYTDLLLDYILHKISDKQCKSTIYVREQKRLRGLEERQIIDAYVTIGEEAFRKLLQYCITFEEFIHEVEQCKSYTQNELNALNIRYEHTGFIRGDIL